MNLEHIDHTFGQEIMPGVAQRHYFIESRYIVLPDLPAAPATLSDITVITQPIPPKLGKKWTRMYSTLDSGEFGYNMQGEADSRSFLSWFEWKYPGTEAQIDGLLTYWKHTPHYFIAVLGNGQRRLMGTALSPCVLKKADGTSGKKGSDYKGVTMRVESTLWCPAPILDPSIEIITVPYSEPGGT